MRDGSFKSVAFSASGGGENSTFNASLGYYDQEGIIINNEFERYTGRFNSSFSKGRFTINQRLGIAFSQNTPQPSYQRFTIPTIPERDPVTGEFSNTLAPEFYISEPRPSSLVSGKLADINNDRLNLIGGVRFTIDLVEGLQYKIDFNGNYDNLHNYAYLPALARTINSSSGDNALTETNSNAFNYVIDNLLLYKKSVDNHNFDILLGTSWNRDNFRGTTVISNNFPSDAVTTPTDASGISSSELKSALLSFFGRVNYDFDNKFLLSASLRRDKSSKFGDPVGVFPGFSAGINFHHLDFFPTDGILTGLKLRGGYGELGNSTIPPYLFVPAVNTNIPTTLGANQDVSFGAVVFPADENLSWETTKSTDIGLDLEFLDGKFAISTNYFIKKSTDLFAALLPAPSTGQFFFNGPSDEYISNGPEIENKGFEALISYRKSGDFSFNITANIASVKNEVIRLGEGVQPIRGYIWSGTIGDRATLTDVGQPVGSFFGYQQDGYYASDAEVTDGPESGSGKQAGDFKFADLNGDGVISPDDRTFIGNPFPNFEYGLNFTGAYKKLDFTLFFQGVSGNDILNHNKYENYFNYSYNLRSEVLNSYDFNPSNPEAPRLSTSNYTNSVKGTVSSFFIEDGSYFRLKNIQVGYNFGSIDKIGFDNLRAYFGIQNAFTITGFSGYDPEVGSASRGVGAATDGRGQASNIIFNRGVDSRSIPRDRTFLIGIQAGF